MDLLDTILNTQNGAAVQQIGAHLGIGKDQAASALTALVPALAAGLQRNTQTSDGLSSLLTALADGQHAQYVNNPSSLSTPGGLEDGTAILGHILGGQAGQVADHAASQTGLSPAIIQQLLPMAAAAMMGALAHHVSTSTSGTASGGTLVNAITRTVAQGSGGGLLGGLLSHILGR